MPSRRRKLPGWLRPGWLRRMPVSVVVAVLLTLTLGIAAAAIAVTEALSSAGTSVAAAPTIDPVAHAPITDSPPTPATIEVSHRPKRLVNGTLLISARHALTRHQAAALHALSGVRRTQWVSAGHASVDHHPGFVVGVTPAQFRPWTPALTARSNALWQSIGRGELTASFDMGHNARLPLGQTVAVHAGATHPLRIGAFASVGMAGVDAVVDDAGAREIGLVPHSGILISAPKADPLALRRQVTTVLGRHVRVEFLRQVVVTRDAGEFLSRHQISAFLAAASSRIGKPYVWGAEGPNAFDCSGLVQWSFAKAGIRMPRVSQEQWLTGPHIPYADAEPGDLLFWHYDPTDHGDVDHVAIYAGKGMMIVAPHTGENVQYVPVPLNDFAGVVRVDPAIAAQIA